jgi:ABC-type nitrate/sulfonate/bicarbonate transport system substrate-binding protein
VSSNSAEETRDGSRREFLRLVAAGAVGFAAEPRPAAAETAATVGTAVLGDYAMVAPVIVALERGYFRADGLDAQFVPFRGGPDLLKAVIGGEALIGLTGGTDIFVFREAGAPIRMVATETAGNHFTLNVAPEIRSVDDLRGKAIGVTKVGSTTWVFARILAHQNGWDPERDITIVALGGLDAQVAALARHEIQAIIWGDGGAVLELQGRTRVLKRLDSITPRWISQIVYASEDTIRRRADDIRKALRAIFQALAFMKEHSEEAATIAAKILKWDPRAVLAAHRLSSPLFPRDGSIDVEALRAMQDTLLEQGVLARRLALADHYTTAFTPVRL